MVSLKSIFPTPIGFAKLDRDFSKTELDFVDYNRKLSHANIGNTISDDIYVLNNPAFADIKEFIQQHVEHYINQVDTPMYDVKPYITHSWLTYTDEGDYHHKHTHPNSYVSGVFYINADITKDRIHFFKNQHRTIEITTKDVNFYNATSWWFEVGTGTLILFPSSLQHMVDTTSSSETRIALAFNTFFEGQLGSKKDLTILTIGKDTSYG